MALIRELKLRELVDGVRDGEFTGREVFESFASRIREMNPSINALFDLKLQPRVGGAGALASVPFSVKASLNVKGFVTDEGSLNDAGEVATGTVDCVESLFRAGGYCIGKTTMPEYGKSYVTESRLHGLTRNPLDPALSPGGSSGGCAAAVAAGMVPFSVCTDAGGSARVPANFCRLFGLFPTPGAVAEGEMGRGMLPFVREMRSVGLIARSVEDLRLLWRIVGRVAAVNGGVGCRRVGVLRELNGVRPEGGIGAAIDGVVRWYEGQGFEVEELGGGVWAESLEPYLVLMGQVSLMAEDRAAEMMGRPRRLELETDGMRATREKVRRLLPELTVERMLWALERMGELRRRAEGEIWGRVDFVVAPVAANREQRLGEGIVVEGRELQSYEAYQFCTAGNFLGVPAVAIPWEGVGVQVMGRRFCEQELLSSLPPP